jgi:uncharacterized protein (TIGR03067 family)
MTRFAATLLLIAAIGRTESTAAQTPVAPVAPKPQERKPVPTKPTSPEKIKSLKPLPRSIVGYSFTCWEISPPIKEPLDVGSILAEEAEIVAITAGIVTIRKLDNTYHDVVIKELSPSTQQTLQRVERLLQEKAAADEKQLLGSWRLVEQTRNGAEAKFKLGQKLIITGTSCHWPGSIDSPPWQVDTKPTPKHLDFDAALPEAAIRAIYELRADELRIVVNDAGFSDRPTAFDRLTDDQTYCVFRRLPSLKDLPPPNPKDLDPELVATIHEFIKLIESGRAEPAIHRMLSPAHLAKYTKAEQDEEIEFFDLSKNRVLLGLKAMLRVAPKLNADRTRAEFDFSHAHLDDFEDNGEPAGFEKIDGRWYLKVEEPPAENAPEAAK